MGDWCCLEPFRLQSFLPEEAAEEGLQLRGVGAGVGEEGELVVLA